MYGSVLPNTSTFGMSAASNTVILRVRWTGAILPGNHCTKMRNCPARFAPFLRVLPTCRALRRATHSSRVHAVSGGTSTVVHIPLPIRSSFSPGSSSKTRISIRRAGLMRGKSKDSPAPEPQTGSAPASLAVEVFRMVPSTVHSTKGSVCPTRSIRGRPLASMTVTRSRRIGGKSGSSSVFASHDCSSKCTVPASLPLGSCRITRRSMLHGSSSGCRLVSTW